MADERSWFLELEEKDEACLPDFLIKAAQKAAEEKGVSKPIINLSRSLIIPFCNFHLIVNLEKKPKRRGHPEASMEKKLIIGQLLERH